MRRFLLVPVACLLLLAASASAVPAPMGEVLNCQSMPPPAPVAHALDALAKALAHAVKEAETATAPAMAHGEQAVAQVEQIAAEAEPTAAPALSLAEHARVLVSALEEGAVGLVETEVREVTSFSGDTMAATDEFLEDALGPDYAGESFVQFAEFAVRGVGGSQGGGGGGGVSEDVPWILNDSYRLTDIARCLAAAWTDYLLAQLPLSHAPTPPSAAPPR